MHVLLGIAVIAVCLWLLSRAIQNARSEPWAGPRSTGMRSRAAAPRSRASGRGRTAMRSAGSAALHPRNGTIRAQARADAHKVWQQAAAANWLEERRHERKNGTGRPAAATATATKPGLRQRLRTILAPFDRAPAEGGGASTPNGNGTGQPAAQGNGGPPARQVPPPPAQASPASTNGGNPVAAPSTASAEQAIEGIQRIHAEAAAGGIRHKQAALKSANEASLRFSSMAQMIARTMSEPGNNYGPEITEPLGQAAQHLQAAAMAFGESDNALTSLIHMTVGELADSARQAPHHSELSENGTATAVRGRVLDNDGWH